MKYRWGYNLDQFAEQNWSLWYVADHLDDLHSHDEYIPLYLAEKIHDFLQELFPCTQEFLRECQTISLVWERDPELDRKRIFALYHKSVQELYEYILTGFPHYSQSPNISFPPEKLEYWYSDVFDVHKIENENALGDLFSKEIHQTTIIPTMVKQILWNMMHKTFFQYIASYPKQNIEYGVYRTLLQMIEDFGWYFESRVSGEINFDHFPDRSVVALEFSEVVEGAMDSGVLLCYDRAVNKTIVHHWRFHSEGPNSDELYDEFTRSGVRPERCEVFVIQQNTVHSFMDSIRVHVDNTLYITQEERKEADRLFLDQFSSLDVLWTENLEEAEQKMRALGFSRFFWKDDGIFVESKKDSSGLRFFYDNRLKQLKIQHTFEEKNTEEEIIELPWNSKKQ